MDGQDGYVGPLNLGGKQNKLIPSGKGRANENGSLLELKSSIHNNSLG
jgi:hypothetical protein